MDQRALSFGNFEVRFAERILTEDGRPVPLGSRALDILVMLVERAGAGGRQGRADRAGVATGGGRGSHTARAHRSAAPSPARRPRRPALHRQCHWPRLQLRGASRQRAAQRPAAGVASPADIPLPTGRLIGRDETVAALAEKVRLRRFVTLVGPGGVGKTAGRAAAAAALAADVEGVVFVDLALVQQPTLVPSALASALGLPARQDDPSGEVADHLASRRVLLLLDSCEHVVDAVARLTECIFASAPHVHILATSREPLRSSGEWVTRLAPLELPPADGPLGAADAHRLARGAVVRRARCGSARQLPASTTPMQSASSRSAATWTACRWPSSWPLRASMRSACTVCRRSSTINSACC